MTATDEPTSTGTPACYRHPKRETYVRCVRCDRYICSDCMRDAAVGQQCVECVKEGNKGIRQARTVFGGAVSVTPWVTYVLIGVNVLVYLAELAVPGLVDRFGMAGLHYTFAPTAESGSPGEMPVVDAAEGGVAHGEWYRLLTGAFLHLPPQESGLGVLHVAFNMLVLWQLGRAAEGMLGALRFAVLYLLSALGGSVLVLLIAPEALVVGASGALFGLTAAFYVFSRRLGHDMTEANRLTVFTLIWLVLSAGFASWQGHLGGLLAGGALALAFAYAPRNARGPVQAGAAVALLVLLVGLAVVKAGSLGTV